MYFLKAGEFNLKFNYFTGNIDNESSFSGDSATETSGPID
jgi:hypothetical protein